MGKLKTVDRPYKDSVHAVLHVTTLDGTANTLPISVGVVIVPQDSEPTFEYHTISMLSAKEIGYTGNLMAANVSGDIDIELAERESISEVLNKISKTLDLFDVDYIWSSHIDGSDIDILERGYIAASKEIPWSYYNVRQMSTLFNASKVTEQMYEDLERRLVSMKNHALKDAIRSTGMLVSAIELLEE